MPRAIKIVALTVLTAALGAFAFAASPAQAQETVTIPVGDFWFCSEAFEGDECVTSVDEGDTVVWSFSGPATHTTTGSGWDSGNQNAGTFSFTFASAGSYSYVCNIHPTLMMGRIEVAAAQQEPTAAPNTPDANATPGPANTPSAVTPPTVGAGPTSGSTNAWWLGAALAGFGLALVGSGLLFARSRVL